VFRDAATTTTLGNWTRWLGLARNTSPRQSVYSAACQLFFRLPNLLEDGQNESLQDLNSLIPICVGANEKVKWRPLAAMIGRNYHQFLEFTRT
jgi:hypothetical protein